MKIGVVCILLLGGLVMFGCTFGDNTTEFPTGRFINEDNDKYIFEFDVLFSRKKRSCLEKKE